MMSLTNLGKLGFFAALFLQDANAFAFAPSGNPVSSGRSSVGIRRVNAEVDAATADYQGVPSLMNSFSTRLGVTASETGVAAVTVPSAAGMAIKGFVRGQKCLLSDEEVRFGSIIFLLRGCDTSQKMVSPLELETNKHMLPGEKIAEIMFLNKKAIEEKVNAAIIAKHSAELDATKTTQLVQQDMATYIRVLQYAVAAGLKKCMRQEVMNYISEMYEELNVPHTAVLTGIEAAKQVIKQLSSSHPQLYEQVVVPPFDIFAQIIKEMMTNTSKAQKTPLQPIVPKDKEPRPEKGTLPKPIFDFSAINMDDVPEQERAQVQAIQKRLAAFKQ